MKEGSGMQNKQSGWPISRGGFLTGVGSGAICVAASGHLFAAARQKEATAVLVPGDMGRYSFVLVGTQAGYRKNFGSACHGAERVMGHRQAKKAAEGRAHNPGAGGPGHHRQGRYVPSARGRPSGRLVESQGHFRSLDSAKIQSKAAASNVSLVC